MDRELSVALAADLRDLTGGLLRGGYTQTTIALLDRNLRHSVPTALGASLVIDRVDVGGTLRLDLVTRTVDPAEVRAAMRVHLDDVRPDVRGWVDFFASVAGAFDRLAADLRRVLSSGPGEPADGPEVGVEVDEQAPLPTRPLVPGLSGLTDFSRVDHALGILLNRGYTLPAARELLRCRALQTGTDVQAVATDIINWF